MRNNLRNLTSREPVFLFMQTIAARFRKLAPKAIDQEEERRLRALARAQSGPAGDPPDEN